MVNLKNISPFPGYSLKTSILALKGNSELAQWQNALLVNPNILKNVTELITLSSCLASQGFLQDAEIAATTSLKRCKKSNKNKYSAMLNLSVIYGQQGKKTMQREILDSVPKHVKKRAVMYANFLNNDDKHDQAIPFFEQAIREEPNFYLPYTRLISCLGFSETALFWSQRALQKIPRDPEVAFHFAYVNFMHQNYSEIVSDIGKFDDFNLELDSRTIGGRADKIQFLEDTKTISLVANTIIEENLAELSNCYKGIASLIHGSRCELVKPLLELTVQSGDISLSQLALNILCDGCKKTFDNGFLLFKTAQVGENLELAESLGNDSISDANVEFRPQFAIEFASFLDDIGKPDEGIRLLTPFFDRDDLHITTRARIFWDGQFYAANTGNWVFSYSLLERFMDLDSEELTEFSGLNSEGVTISSGFYGSFIDKAPLNKLYILIALRRFDEFLREFDQYRQMLSVLSSLDAVDAEILAERKEIESQLSNMHDWAVAADTDTYHNDFFVQSKLITPFFESLRGKLKSINVNGSIFSIADLMFEQPNAVDRNKSLSIYSSMLQQNGDYSVAINSLSSNLNTFGIFPDEVKSALIEGEFRYIHDVRHYDYSPTILSYCKALEIYIRLEIFGKFDELFEGFSNRDEILKSARDDKKSNQYLSLLSFFKTGRIELGAMERVFAITKGKTGGRVALLDELRKFLQRSFPAVLENEVSPDIALLASKYRNPAVHADRFGTDDLYEVRKIVFSVLKLLSDLRLIREPRIKSESLRKFRL